MRPRGGRAGGTRRPGVEPVPAAARRALAPRARAGHGLSGRCGAAERRAGAVRAPRRAASGAMGAPAPGRRRLLRLCPPPIARARPPSVARGGGWRARDRGRPRAARRPRLAPGRGATAWRARGGAASPLPDACSTFYASTGAGAGARRPRATPSAGAGRAGREALTDADPLSTPLPALQRSPARARTTRRVARPAAAASSGLPDDDRPPAAPSAVDAEWAALRARLGAAGAGPLSSVDEGWSPHSTGDWSRGGSPAPGAPAASADDTWDWLDDAGFTPLPSSLPIEGVGGPPPLPFPADAAAWRAAAASPRAAPPAPPSWHALATVYVILFGVGRADTEGIYSLRGAHPDDAALAHDTVVAFECEDDAARYAALLEAAMDHAPSVCPIDPAELLEFCADAGYAARLEPTGTPLLPPECNVGLTDWERSVRLRAGGWSVLPAEPEVGGAGGADAGAAPDDDASRHLTPFPASFAGFTNNAGAYTGPAGVDLDEVRASLERLFAGEDEGAGE